MHTLCLRAGGERRRPQVTLLLSVPVNRFTNSYAYRYLNQRCNMRLHYPQSQVKTLYAIISRYGSRACFESLTRHIHTASLRERNAIYDGRILSALLPKTQTVIPQDVAAPAPASCCPVELGAVKEAFTLSDTRDNPPPFYSNLTWLAPEKIVDKSLALEMLIRNAYSII